MASQQNRQPKKKESLDGEVVESGTKLFESVREEFLERLAEHGNISRACDECGVNRMSYYNWCDAHPDFAQRADECVLIGKKRTKSRLRDLAIDGLESILAEKKNIVSIIYTLKNTDPDDWKDEQHHVVDGMLPTKPMTVEEIENERAKLTEAITRIRQNSDSSSSGK